MLPGDRLLVVFIESLQIGATFSKWPLHITIVPWFRNDAPNDVISLELHERLRGIRCFQANVGWADHFGHGRKAVELIELPSPLVQVEQIVRAYLKEKGSWLVDETTHVQRPYRPHITRQGAIQARTGDIVEITKLAIVQQYGDFKKLESCINLDK